MVRRFMAPPDGERCECDRLALSDGSGARCMHRKAKGSRYCAQHARIIDGWRPSEETRRELAAGNRLARMGQEGGSMPIVQAAGYEVDLSTEPPTVKVVKHRKPLGRGFSYAPGADTYRSTIKVGSANWKRAVRAARASLAEA